MITTGGEEKDFFVIPDLGTEFGKVDKSESTPQEKLKKKKYRKVKKSTGSWLKTGLKQLLFIQRRKLFL